MGHGITTKDMPVGCEISCAAFETFSTFLEWVLKDKMGGPQVAHDYYLIGEWL